MNKNVVISWSFFKVIVIYLFNNLYKIKLIVGCFFCVCVKFP